MSEFYPFFAECSINESDELRKQLFINLAMCKGCGHVVVKKNGGRYLCIDNSREFKIPNSYDKKDHLKLIDEMKINKVR